MKSVSFNQWLSIQQGPQYSKLRSAWQTTRGRLTRQSVIDRAARSGVPANEAADAYDAYCVAIGVSSPTDSLLETDL